MASAIKTKIINNIKTLIPLMTIANGYSRDYGSVDEDAPGSMVFPATWLLYPDENPLDEDLNVINRYTVLLPIIFRVILNTATDLDEQMALIVGDFGKMFAVNHPALQTNGLISADFSGSNSMFRLVKAYPAEIIISYILKYRWQKEYPFST